MNTDNAQVHSLSDPRIGPFVDVTRQEKRESSTHFIAEGENVTLRLLASTYRCERVLCVDRKADRIRPHLQPSTELLLANETLLQEIVGFKFHSGVMGLGHRLTESAVLPEAEDLELSPILVLPEITDPANLGALLRVAAAFGVGAVVLGERCRDPFTRQSIRTSMGTIFSLRLIRSKDIRQTLTRMRNAGIELFATVLDADASPLATITPPRRCALLMGNEGPGLDRDLVNACQQRITIPMRLNTDSLNVVVACGIFLNHFSR
jgi:tRNA G18 (ribose-2'-O)-methylase SpoU